ncbi:MAG: hypothetical protein ACXWDL_13765 [Nocardioides sp.]
MSTSDETVTPSDDEIDQHVETFWRQSVFKAKINHMPSYFGPTPLEVVRPPAWSWGENDAEADAFVTDLVAGRTTGFAVPAGAYADEEPAPEVGEMGIVLDSGMQPRALVVTTEVLSVSSGELDRDATVVDGGEVPPGTPMLLQRIRLLHHA